MDNSYTTFALVYDSFMDNIPYGQWTKHMVSYLTQAGMPPGTKVLELGCGTGSMTIRMAKAGYDMVGTDLSRDMLLQAKKRSKRAGVKIRYELQDMRALDMEGETYPVIFSVCDCVNYLRDVEELKATLDAVYQTLPIGGLFLFDLKTESFYRDVLGEQTFTDTNEYGTYIWENYYDATNRNNEYELTFFLKKTMGMYQKYTEEHMQHAFLPQEVEQVSAECGFRIRDCLGVNMKSSANWDGERVYYILEKV